MTTVLAPDACPNCGAHRVGRFCVDCGQDNGRDRLEFRRILLQGVQSMLGWDTALGRTLRLLARSPGTLAAEYVGGRRKRYVNPARFCLFALAAWLLLTRIVGLDAMDATGLKFTASSADAAERAQIEDEVQAFIGSQLNVLLYLTLPVLALSLQLFFRRSGRNLAENLVLVFYVSGFGYLLGILCTPLLLASVEQAPKIRSLVAFGWLVWAASTFHGLGWFATFWRVLCASFMQMTAVVFSVLAVLLAWFAIRGQ